MDTPQWSQQVATTLARPMDEIENTTPPNNNNNNNNSTNSRGNSAITQQQDHQQASQERRTRPPKDQNINCPRCNSLNTKFCYYNNYSLTQPRFFCKTCRRYWTQGGSLRNVPVGGGSRKNKRSSSSSYSNAPLSTPLQLPSTTTNSQQSHNNNKLIIPDLNPPPSLPHLHQNPNSIKYLEGQDLNLAFPMQGLFHHNIDHQLPKMEGNSTKNDNYDPCTTTTTTTATTNNSTSISALELLRSGINSRGGLNPFVPMSMSDSNTLYQSGYPNFQEFKPSNMNLFSSPISHEHNDDQNGARLLFPLADMNKFATNNNTTQHHHDQSAKGGSGNDHHHNGYWSGMLGGGTW